MLLGARGAKKQKMGGPGGCKEDLGAKVTPAPGDPVSPSTQRVHGFEELKENTRRV